MKCPHCDEECDKILLNPVIDDYVCWPCGWSYKLQCKFCEECQTIKPPNDFTIMKKDFGYMICDKCLNGKKNPKK